MDIEKYEIANGRLYSLGAIEKYETAAHFRSIAIRPPIWMLAKFRQLVRPENLTRK